MSPKGEAKPSQGSKGAAMRDCDEADAQARACRQWTREAEA
jgi:hypothetical protein